MPIEPEKPEIQKNTAYKVPVETDIPDPLDELRDADEEPGIPEKEAGIPAEPKSPEALVAVIEEQPPIKVQISHTENRSEQPEIEPAQSGKQADMTPEKPSSIPKVDDQKLGTKDEKEEAVLSPDHPLSSSPLIADPEPTEIVPTTIPVAIIERLTETPTPTSQSANQALAALDELLRLQGEARASLQNASTLGYLTSPLAARSHLSTIFSESEADPELEEEGDDVAELSELKSIAEPLDFKKASFSSIASTQGRQDFVDALHNIHQALAQPSPERQKTPLADEQPLQVNSTHIRLTDRPVQRKMDSPQDYSPNGSPRHVPIPPQHEHSNPESVDSTGFEKLERPSDDVLEQYSQNFAQQMQQSLFGQLPDDPDFARDAGFELVEAEDTEGTMRLGAGSSRGGGGGQAEPPFHNDDSDQVHILHRIPGDIDGPGSSPMERTPRDDILEKSYGGHDDDLVDIPHNNVPHHDLLGDVHEAEPRHPSPPRDDLDDLLAPVHDIAHHDQPHRQQPAPPSPPAIHHQEDPIHHDDLYRDRPIHDEPIREHVEDLHDDVDALMAGLKGNEETWAPAAPQQDEHPASPSGDSGRDTVGKLLGETDGPHFGRQTPEEQMMERSGPLTIPELPEAVPQLNDDELDAFVRPASGHGFETEPRPPTPPKDLSDEDVKPSVVNLGPAPPHHHHGHKHSILKHGSSSPWFDFKSVDPRVLDLIYWRDPKKSGVALSLTLIALFVFAKYPILSVVVYTSLAVLAGTVGFRLFKAVEAQIKKTEQQNPFQPLLDHELTVPQEKVHEQVDVLVEHGQVLANQTRRLFLVESIVDSVKFGLLLWALTYVTSWFSGFGLLILFVLGIFSIPKFYEVYQEPIDQNLGLIKGHIDNITNTLEEKLPFLKKKVETEKKEQ
ncbi:unnamed protein product, partial [Mesorhabditis spiculigera]